MGPMCPVGSSRTAGTADTSSASCAEEGSAMSRSLLALLLLAGGLRASDLGVSSSQKPLPINLATALALAGAEPLDIAIASRRVQAAAADLERARAVWLPTFYT